MSNEILCADRPEMLSGPAAAVIHTEMSPLICIPYGPNARPNGFEALAGEWNQLLQRSRFDNFFLTHEWQTTWWDHLGEGELWILALRRADTRELVGIVPLYLVTISEGPNAGKHEFNLVGCLEVSDYLDVLAVDGWEAAVYRELLAWLTGPEAPHWDILDLCNLPEDSPTYQDLPPLFTQAGFQVDIFQEDTAPQFDLPFRYEEYLQNLVDKKQRHEIRRKQRRAEREAVVGFTLIGEQHALEAEVDDFVALQRASRVDKADFMTVRDAQIFRRCGPPHAGRRLSPSLLSDP